MAESSEDNELLTDSSRLPLLVDISLLQRISPAKVLLVAVMEESAFNAGHIPGSVLVQPAELVCGLWPAVGKLPDVDSLSVLFSRIGLEQNSHVIAYDNERGGWAGRLLWTLDVVGHAAWSYLDGGLMAWRAAQQPLSNSPVRPTSTRYHAVIDSGPIASLEDVLAQINDPGSVVWDARTAEEYRGEKITAARNGHIPGAVNLDWLELMMHDRCRCLKPPAELARLLDARGISAGKAVIAHCQTHHRSALAYLVGKLLGLNIKAYDGSWAEWGNHPDTPVEVGDGSGAAATK
ncbi:MAG: sulfurtransferase [Pseudohongiellaceae bacterium]